MEMTRLRFQDLLGEGIAGEVRLTQGQMLLLCLNGLFEKVETGLLKLEHHLKTMPALENHMELLEDAQHRMVFLRLIPWRNVFPYKSFIYSCLEIRIR